MVAKYLIALAALPLALTACSKVEEDGGDGSGLTIDFSDDSKADSEKIKIGGGGDDSKFSIKADGFSMAVDLPSITLDRDNLDMNNVDLYPGSQVTSFNIQNVEGSDGKVEIGFKAPQGAENLANWYEQKLTANDFQLVRDGTRLSGKTADGDPFSLAITALSGDESNGVLVFSERK